ncbi:type VI secretion system baseplate subunit TssG [Polymorphobacter sp. PAMC 29334]|uniref:type VI secretion system baseplate subunit TssG n=1 Tax=Polymorphobacter sp. PAMC 29334 TaxID=2862331 RepID=UPI001C793200|nr:type VI secretion system baseplate subunit TssG [Polymorphobacter sp. PAMC 29334]QYE35379.1 type VI secretion system baseplate subunit TssG [Polymorphobacter sp. PAMC 29334]
MTADPDIVEFFEFVRERLEAARREGTHAATIGGDDSPVHEAVRFTTAVGQRHFADEVANIAGADGTTSVTVAFMGLTGPSGVLPDHYTERVVDERRERNFAFGEFLDIFNHRALSHFWRAWAKYRLPIAFESDGGRLDDSFSRALKSLAGLGVANEPVRDEAWLSMTGAMSRRVRSSGALRRIVEGIYGLPVEILELRGRWVDLAPSEQTRLGAGLADDGAFATLAQDAVAGAAIWDVVSRFRVRVGPLDFEDFQKFFAGTTRAEITDTIRRAVGGNIDFTIQLVLRGDAVPQLRLDDAAVPAALGQSTWLLAGPATGDRDEAVLNSGGY